MLRVARDGVVSERFPGRAVVYHYFDPLPTNCVADWVCPCSGDDLSTGPRRYNLAVFYGSCNSDCLFCQNSEYREMMAAGAPLMTPQELAAVAHERTACVCYFGGDPSCNAAHSIETSQLLIQEGIKVCYETNGLISRKWLDRIAEVVQKSGGTIKVDLKAVTPAIYHALTGVSNRTVLNNFRTLAEIGRGLDRVFLVASILLVPEYVGLAEVQKICEFIAACDPNIPTALLGFAPHHVMTDLPRTSREHAFGAKAVAERTGLTNVRVGNIALLSHADYRFD